MDKRFACAPVACAPVVVEVAESGCRKPTPTPGWFQRRSSSGLTLEVTTDALHTQKSIHSHSGNFSEKNGLPRPKCWALAPRAPQRTGAANQQSNTQVGTALRGRPLGRFMSYSYCTRQIRGG